MVKPSRYKPAVSITLPKHVMARLDKEAGDQYPTSVGGGNKSRAVEDALNMYFATLDGHHVDDDVYDSVRIRLKLRALEAIERGDMGDAEEFMDRALAMA